MHRKVICLGLIVLWVLCGWTASAQQGVAEHDLWKANLITLSLGNWYLRATVGALANIQPSPFQASGFAYLRLGLMWNPGFLLTPQMQLTGVTHEVGIGLRGLGVKPYWELEITPFILEFNLSKPSAGVQQPIGQQVVQPDQQTTIDLKALVLARWDDLFKASDQVAKENPALQPETFRDPLNEFKKAFEAGKTTDAALQLSLFSVLLRMTRKAEAVKDYDETHLRTGLHRLVAASVLFVERVQRQTAKVCTGLYVSEDQKSEEVISPFVNEAIKKLTFTNRQTGVKETFTLKESKCF